MKPPRLHSPHQRSCEMRKKGKESLSSERARGRSAGQRSGRRAWLLAEQWQPSPRDAALSAARSAPLLGCFCPTCSFSACQDCSTLSVLPGKRLSIHLVAGEVLLRASSVTAGAEEREERGSSGCPSAPPASSAKSAQPSPAALLGTAVLTSPTPPAPPTPAEERRAGWGAESEDV